MTDEERARSIWDNTGEYLATINRLEAEVADLKEAMAGATRIANLSGSLLRERDAEIERLESQLQNWKDTGMATATEARLLHELAQDYDHATKLLSDYPVIEFYTLRKVRKVEQWTKVYGKKITTGGLEFGSYFDKDLMRWHVIELTCGMSFCSTETFESSIARTTVVVNRIGMDLIESTIEEEIKQHEPRPEAPRIVPQRVSEGVKSE